MASLRKVEGTYKEGCSQKIELSTSSQWSTTDDEAVLKETGYVALKKIGHGSFAKVWKAKSFRLKKDVAIKIIAKPQASSEYVERFLPRELAIIQKLKHKNLIKFYEVIETWHSVYIVMELAEKGTIADLIERNKYIPENQSKRFYLQLIDVVEYCHLNGIVHRDIKCENLLLDRGGNLLLTDFGFAKQDVFPMASGQLRLSRTFCGSYAYAPPEVLANKPYNPCLADIWCMGMVLFTMLFGVLPYKNRNIKALIAAKTRPPAFPDMPSTSHEVKKFLLLMLTTEEDRAQIIRLRSDPWLYMQKTQFVKRFSWLPGMRNTTLEVEEINFSECSILSSGTSSLTQTFLIENKSITVDMSGLLETKIPTDRSDNSNSSESETTILMSHIA